MVKDGNHDQKYALFWDFENMMLAGEALNAFFNDLTQIIAQLTAGKAERLEAECYGRWGSIPDATQEALGTYGFHLIQVPKAGDNALDSLLITNALVLCEKGACTHFILIAADGDYCKLCVQLCEKHVSVSIIGRAGSFSSDYLTLPLKTYFVNRNGRLLANVIKDKAAQIQLMEIAMKDAGAALGNMQGLPFNAGIQVFSYIEWEEQYKKLESPEIPLSQIMQVIPLVDLFRCFIEVRGFSSSRDFAHFYCGTQGHGKNIADVEIIQKLPPLCVISTPVNPSVKIVIEAEAKPAEKLDKNALMIDPSQLLDPDNVQLGRKVLEELLQVHSSYKYLLFQIFWMTLQQRSKELACMGLTANKIPLEFYRKVSEGNGRVKINDGNKQWDILNPVKLTKKKDPEGRTCPECHKVFKSAQACTQHRTSGIHSKITA